MHPHFAAHTTISLTAQLRTNEIVLLLNSYNLVLQIWQCLPEVKNEKIKEVFLNTVKIQEFSPVFVSPTSWQPTLSPLYLEFVSKPQHHFIVQ
jgi:hypothetical protein